MSRVLLIGRILATLLTVVATACALRWWVFVPLRCSHAASVGAGELDAAVDPTDFRTQRLERRIVTSLQSCDCVTPPDARIFFVRGAVAQDGGNLQTAVADYRRALEIDRRPEIYLHLGLAQIDSSDHASGIENLVRACAFDPWRIPAIDGTVRHEVKERLHAKYGADWVR